MMSQEEGGGGGEGLLGGRTSRRPISSLKGVPGWSMQVFLDSNMIQQEA